jgi:hypothetical protein
MSFLKMPAFGRSPSISAVSAMKAGITNYERHPSNSAMATVSSCAKKRCRDASESRVWMLIQCTLGVLEKCSARNKNVLRIGSEYGPKHFISAEGSASVFCSLVLAIAAILAPMSGALAQSGEVSIHVIVTEDAAAMSREWRRFHGLAQNENQTPAVATAADVASTCSTLNGGADGASAEQICT